MPAPADKRALCVGINDYPVPGRDLRGAVNDAKAWARLLRGEYGFGPRQVKLLLDEQATRARILDELERLLEGTRAGDLRVFMIACHGTYVADDDDDEADEYDEALCPWDYRDGLILDDDLRERLADVPARAHVVVITDSCFSGTVTRFLVDETTREHRRPRFLPPDAAGRAVIEDVRVEASPRRRPSKAIKELHLSACRSDQYAFDDKFGRKYGGAMTHHAIALLESEPGLTYGQLLPRLRKALAGSGYDQQPQLDGPTAAKRRQVFT